MARGVFDEPPGRPTPEQSTCPGAGEFVGRCGRATCPAHNPLCPRCSSVAAHLAAPAPASGAGSLFWADSPPTEPPAPAPLNPSGVCQCGCGGAAPLAQTTNASTGYVRGQPVRFISGHNRHAPRPPAVGPVDWERLLEEVTE